MRILTRYILREIVSHAGLGGVLFTFVLFLRDLGKILELIVRGSASVGDVARILLYTLPSILILTIPVAVLVGILLGLSRLAVDSEVVAMRASGFGIPQFVGVASIVAVLAFAIALVNSVYIVPAASARLIQLETDLKTSQASYEVQPRVFYEDFHNYVLYVQDVMPAQGASVWRNVFLADLSQPATPRITTAREAVVVNDSRGTLRLRFMDGAQHQINPVDSNDYEVTSFADTEAPIQAAAAEDVRLTRNDTPLLAMPLRTLWQNRSGKAGLQHRIELNKRLSYPFACIVLMLAGVPIGIQARRGGKSSGFVLTLALVFLYYFFSSVGVALAKQGRLSAFTGVWAANIIFGVAGCWLLLRMQRMDDPFRIAWLGDLTTRLVNRLQASLDGTLANGNPARPRRSAALRTYRFPLIFDNYVLREFLSALGLIFLSFVTLSLFFSFFELLGDIIRNRTPLITVGEYLLDLIPYMLSNLTPLCALLAVLVTFGALSRSSELTAMKASGVSLYRLITPVVVMSAILAVGLFAFDEFYLPGANRRQESLRSVIKGKPAQTFSRPDRKWISGEQDSVGEPARIFYYQFYDPDKNLFANLSVFQFAHDSFRLEKRTFAASAHWDESKQRWILENGWERTFDRQEVSSYRPFMLREAPEIHEQPSYFKKEDRPSQEMSFVELNAYIRELRQGGFDTLRLRVQLYRKIAYPLVTLIMAVLAVPFALRAGKRGSLAGIAIAVGLAIAYTILAGTFEAMGNVNALPPSLAAWAPDLLFALFGGYMLLRSPT